MEDANNNTEEQQLSSPLLGTQHHENDGILETVIRTTEVETLDSRIRHRKWLKCYQRMVICLSLPPLYFLAMEMTKEHCHFCHEKIDDSHNVYIIMAAAVWGSFMATLYEACGSRKHSWCGSIIGGALAASGSLFTMWMLLKSITTGDVVFVFALVVGVLGAMPGIMLYYVAKILCIELYRSTVPLPATATIQSHPKVSRERIMSDNTFQENSEGEEIV